MKNDKRKRIVDSEALRDIISKPDDYFLYDPAAGRAWKNYGKHNALALQKVNELF